jgi:hypothetical protein
MLSAEDSMATQRLALSLSNLNVKLSDSALLERVRDLPVGPPHGIKTQMAPGAQNHPQTS